jgi:hypothetical protein
VIALPEIPKQVKIMSDQALAGAILALVATGRETDRLADLQAEIKRRRGGAK